MADKISFDHDLIVAHAARVRQVASDVGVAQNAAGASNMGGGAFGVLCSFLVPPATIAATAAQTAIGSAQGMVQRSAVEISGIGEDFRRFEQEATAAIKALEG